ncbi:phospholipase D-like domain-containing protein [Pedobacter sp. PF22-3]|uniref:phospholipase D-like domain-containing protein n=1 Tax=Pedobacter sp. PF22-3 TaxID=2994467 RepID=UPI00224829E9|nr:phospholipase D-like domain-containing protein [Pedobacter sp. PF22-3]MCX2493000.1 phospholipase D-like domain-containing protein [Pedobacter sp. PF22-3]
MKLTSNSIEKLAPFLLDRNGKQLVSLFNDYGALDKYEYSVGLPDIGKKNGQRPSKTQYIEHRLNELSGKPELRNLLTDVINDLKGSEDAISKINDIINRENLQVIEVDGTYSIQGGVVVKAMDTVNNPHFQGIQDEILVVLDSAQVSISVAIAWFTNDVLFNKLVEKSKAGVDVHVAIFDDGINKKHGVDISQLKHSKIGGSRKGLMHNKFCIVDNQIVVTGSYNWSTNAETRNDENITVQQDPKSATKYSLEFRRLIS